MMKLILFSLWALLIVGGALAIEYFPRRPVTAIAGNEPEQRTAQYFQSIRNQPDRLVAFLKNMPKGADLHTHLSGAVYAETFMAWAAAGKMCVDPTTFELAEKCSGKTQVKLSADLSKNDPVFYRKLIDAWSTRNWEKSGRTGHYQFFETFKRWGPLTSRFGEMIAEVRARAAEGNVSYLEIMITPDGGESKKLGAGLKWQENFILMRQQLLKAGLVEKAVAAARKTLDQAEQTSKEIRRCGQAQPDKACDVEVRYIFQVGRMNPPAQVFAQMLAAFEIANDDSRVVGLNLVQPEDNEIAMKDFGLHMRMLDYLKSIYSRIHITLHAGELAPGLVPPEGLLFHIRDSVQIGHAERIGHGVDLMQETNAAQLLQEMAARDVMVEICLTSNDVILGVRGEKHPIRQYLAAGVPVALATDDEGVARSEITREYLKAVEDHNLGYADFKRMARTSLQYAFIAGESIWKNFRTSELTPACYEDHPESDTLSAGCQQFLNNNNKAALQWRLEKNLATFERQNQ
jgi:adenosine deaminase